MIYTSHWNGKIGDGGSAEKHEGENRAETGPRVDASMTIINWFTVGFMGNIIHMKCSEP